MNARLILSIVTLSVCCLAGQTDAALVGYWSFDGNLQDGSGNGNNGAFLGSPLPTFSGDTPAGLAGGQSVLFGGSSGRVEVADSAALDLTTTITLMAWVNETGTAHEGILVKNPSNGSSANHAGNYELRVNPGDAIDLGYQQGGVDDTTAHSSTSTIPSGWNHVAVTLTQGGPGAFYINGSLAGTFTASANFGATNTNPLLIGNRADSGTPMIGRIDDAGIFDVALTFGKVRGVVSVANGLGYDLGLANELFRVFDGEIASADIGNILWAPGNGLGGTAGDLVSIGGGQYFLNLDGVNGVLGLQVPEPSTGALLSLGALALARRRTKLRRRSRA